MPESIVSVNGSIVKISPTEDVLTNKVKPCSKCGDNLESHREVRLAGLCGKGLYCSICGEKLGEII